jgi:hypothetical protein
LAAGKLKNFWNPLLFVFWDSDDFRVPMPVKAKVSTDGTKIDCFGGWAFDPEVSSQLDEIRDAPRKEEGREWVCGERQGP